jgi:hypothetical protein
MIQGRDGPSFAFEALPGFRILREMLGKYFYSDRAVKTCVERLIHFTHSARSQRKLDLIRPELRT